jgi:hypothetical protein
MRLLASDLDQQIQVCSCDWGQQSCLVVVCGVQSTTLTTQPLMIIMRQETIEAPVCLDVVSYPRRFKVVAKVP